MFIGGAGQRAKQPNIILFLVDDMGWQDTSEPFWSERTHFNDRYQTPAMEKLATVPNLIYGRYHGPMRL